MLGVPKFEIRHVDIHQTVHELYAFDTVVRRSVVDEGQTQTALDGNHKRFQDLRNDVLGCDKVDVVTTDPLQIEHDLRKLGRRDFCAFTKLARPAILTKHPAHSTPAQKKVCP